MKKLISLLAVSLLSVAMAAAASAAPNVAVADVEAKAGETVTVDVVLSGNTAFDDLSVEFGYDASVLTLKSASQIDVPGITANYAYNIDTNPYNMNWPGDVTDYNGKITTLTFEIAADAAPGKYPITVSHYKGNSGNYEDGVDCNYLMDWDLLMPVSIELTYTNGSITVKKGPTLAAEKTSDGVVITATAVPADSKFIVAAYDANGLTKVEVLDAAETATSTVTGDNVKVMWWDSLTSLTSIVDAIDL